MSAIEHKARVVKLHDPDWKRFGRLPFVGPKTCWDMPKRPKRRIKASYAAGRAAGVAFLKFLRDQRGKEHRYFGSTLPNIVQAMFGTLSGAETMGFFTEIDYALQAYINLFTGLDRHTEEELAKKVRGSRSAPRSRKRAQQ